ncbi:hypothetical protein ACFX2C_034725 [Malus domestica]
MLAAVRMGARARRRTEREEGEIGGMDMEGLTNMKLGIERRMWVREKNGEMDMDEVWRQGTREREKRGMKNRKIASWPFKGLFSTKMVCKKFNQFGQDDRIFERINIREFESFNLLSSWIRYKDVSNFLKRCTNCGIKALKKAISKGHEVATSMYGVVLMAQRCFSGLLVDREVRARILKFHDDNNAMKAYAAIVEVHKVLSHSDRIQITLTMKNSVAVIHADGIKK